MGKSWVSGADIESIESRKMREDYEFQRRFFAAKTIQKNGAIVSSNEISVQSNADKGDPEGHPPPRDSLREDRSDSSERWRSFLAGEGTAPGPEAELSSSPAPRSAIGPPVDWASGRIALDRMAEREESKRRYTEELTAEILALRPHFFDRR